MKKLTYTLLFCLLGVQLLSAQGWNDRHGRQYENDWSIGAGLNGVSDSGLGISELFNDIDYWNFGNPIYINAENYINNQFSVGVNLSFNKYKPGKVIDGGRIPENSEGSYVAFDFAIKYSFRDLFKLKSFEPYVFIGAGYTHIGEYKIYYMDQVILAKGRMTFNTGLGANYWFNRDWGINLNIAGKFGIGKTVTNQLQSSIGVLYHLNN